MRLLQVSLKKQFTASNKQFMWKCISSHFETTETWFKVMITCRDQNLKEVSADIFHYVLN